MLNGKNILLHGYQTVTFPEGFHSEIQASGMRATLAGDEEVRLNETRIRIRGDQVEINGITFGAGIVGYGDLETGFRVLAEDDLSLSLLSDLPSGDGRVVCTLNGREIVISGRRTLTIPEGIQGTVEAEKMMATMATLTSEEVVTINGREFRTYGEKVEVDGRAFPVADGEVLELTSGCTSRHDDYD